MNYKIALLPGDGIGEEVICETVRVLNAAAERFGFKLNYTYLDIGGAAYDKHGTPLPEETICACKASDSVILGAVGGDKWNNLPPELRPESGLLGIRKELGVYANLRPVKMFKALVETAPLKNIDLVDLIIVRELTGGIYFGKKGRVGDSAFDTETYSKFEIERVAHVAFALASIRKKSVILVDKANVMITGRLWRETVEKVSGKYPDIELRYMYVDNCAMQLIRNPMAFDVILTSNMFGDILSDEASMLTGSIGMLPSGSIGAKNPGLYEAAHGSAPDIAGKGKANPSASILSGAMMLRYSLNEALAADAIERAVASALKICRTPDIKTDSLPVVGTVEMGSLIARLIKDGE